MHLTHHMYYMYILKIIYIILCIIFNCVTRNVPIPIERYVFMPCWLVQELIITLIVFCVCMIHWGGTDSVTRELPNLAMTAVNEGDFNVASL